MLVNANTPTGFGNKKTESLERIIYSHSWNDILEHFRNKFEQQKEDNSKRASPLETSLMTTHNEFEQYIHHAIRAYTNK